jgi:hypothetical protein
LLGAVVSGDLGPSTAGRFVVLSDAGAGGLTDEFRAAFAGALDRQALVALLESAQKQPNDSGHDGGPSAVAWATLRAIAAALPDGGLGSGGLD